ncbi:12350_t:CDS:2 [Entrophospora sp. SA101]|nr:6978_t:CDS:2 [Entrophospora sp. SA101]CAJ0645416.1 6459_t:CDS:2 [Entrophospora sp. SA101]CAJ0758544.1 12350_t:CDS:2 [Entrophospora sp. SA101]CAJ0888819.1 13485_t:CDS:2 [Entrophospora sp. SA101]CAJ0920109.1 14214_t:CDS:2 [Entrophospora sp. SA101]
MDEAPAAPSYALPDGWFLAGSAPDNYLAGVDYTTYYGPTPARGGILVSGPNYKAVAGGFGTVMQAFNPTNLLGKRVQMSGFVKSTGVINWAGMWMRIDRLLEQAHAFDNMHNRSITGTTDWTEYKIVLDAPEDSAMLAFGFLLIGEGTIWIDEVNFQIVDPDKVPVTGGGPNGPATPAKIPKGLLDHPINLSF